MALFIYLLRVVEDLSLVARQFNAVRGRKEQNAKHKIEFNRRRRRTGVYLLRPGDPAPHAAD
eukprot:4961815-Amphidinium_carterae.2